MIRRIGLLMAGLALAACTGAKDLDAPLVPLGDFSLGHNVVVAPKVQTTAAVSREVPKEELVASLQSAIAERFDRYEGTKDYHFGVSIEGYVLAKRGVPVVAAPKSAMIIRLTVWDDARGVKLNEEPEQLTVLETLDGESIVGTGWSQSAETQLLNLSRNTAQAIENYLVKMKAEEGWFQDVPGTASLENGEASPSVIEEKLVTATE
ncbi:hypothetical protein [uncultured Roseobacter sp.]|uniref:hypothetical protein n=1 Tax=uncultured Roseobacter sp. TaxID=114847 RepID=UPI002609BFF3|nr:hypothetical protein [uncultured Roseobacter sp.]